MNKQAFFERAYSNRGPKVVFGFSRPIYHNLIGLLHGHQFNKMSLGGMIRHTEAGMLYKWAKEVPAQGVIVEIGCYGGLSTSYLAQGSAASQAKIFSIDPFDTDFAKQAERSDNCVALENKPSRQVVLDRLTAIGAAHRLELIEGYSQEVVKTWNRPIDLLWIDGNHDQALLDFTDWSPFVTRGGRVGFHDAHPRYGYPQVAEDARKAFSEDGWTKLEHVKSIITAVKC